MASREEVVQEEVLRSIAAASRGHPSATGRRPHSRRPRFQIVSPAL